MEELKPCQYCTGDTIQLDELGHLFIGYGNVKGWFLRTEMRYPDYTRISHCPFCGRKLGEQILYAGIVRIKTRDTYKEER